MVRYYAFRLFEARMIDYLIDVANVWSSLKIKYLSSLGVIVESSISWIGRY